MPDTLKPATKLQHSGFHGKVVTRPLVTPIYQSVKFEFSSFSAIGQHFADPHDGEYFYSRDANPTVEALAFKLKEMVNAEDALLTSSGMGAVFLCLYPLLKPKDRVIHFMEGYKPIRKMLSYYRDSWQIETVLLSIQEKDKIAKELAQPQTKAIIFESPTNPQLRSLDIKWLTKLARKHAVITIWDHTAFGARSDEGYEVDLYLQSLTKFASGHGDVMGGAICGRRDLLARIREHAAFIGQVLDPHAAFLIDRGLKTFDLRFQRASQSAKEVSSWMRTVKSFTHVACEGGLIFAVLLEGEEALGKFIDRLMLFAAVASFGSCESLIMPVSPFCEGLTAEEQEEAGLYRGGFRLSIGLEDPCDLVADLSQAISIFTLGDEDENTLRQTLV